MTLSDGIPGFVFDRQGGSQLLLDPVAGEQGYAATFAIGLVT